MHNKRLGAAGEDLAAQFLVKAGYRILARNLKTRYGEVDIVALVGQTMVIVEVKTKSNLNYGSPVEMVGRTKQERLRKIATHLAHQKNYHEYQIDIIAILYIGAQFTLEHYIAVL